MPVLSHYGYDIYALPTAIMSNTMDYGKFTKMDTTEYMVNTMRVWRELNFSFDAVCIGYVSNEDQLRLILQFCRSSKARILYDPIMAKLGKLYNGISRETISIMTRLSSVADIVIPNYTEACYMTFTPYSENATKEDMAGILNQLRQSGCRTVVATSVPYENGWANVVYNGNDNEITAVPYTKIPVNIPGVGDIFTAVFLAHVLEDGKIIDGVRAATEITYELIAENRDNLDLNKGIRIESCMHLLK
ncbi:MAG: PfkB family carbohydrate kinase [Catenisphaera adipataccumulans]